MFSWKRSNFDKFPTVYTRFRTKNPENDDLIEYHIQDLPEDRFEDALNFIMNDDYLKEEAFAKGLEVTNSPEAILEFRELYKTVMNQKLTLVCFKEGSDKIVALNVLYVRDKEVKDSGYPLKSDAMKKFFAVGKFINSLSRPFEPQNDRFVLKGLGLSVNCQYRKRGIAVKMLESRIEFMKSVGLGLTTTIFTGIGSQIAAKKAGYTEYFTISYEELERNGHHFEHLSEKCVKTLGYQI